MLSWENYFLDGSSFLRVCFASMSDLTTTQAAERLGVTRHTVGIWCRRGLLPGAYELDAGRGKVWLIPPNALEGFTPPKPTGRPPKAKTAKKPAGTSRKKAGAKTSIP